MSASIKIKRSTTAGNTPTLALGELGCNVPDSKLWVGSGSANILLAQGIPVLTPGRLGLSSTTAYSSTDLLAQGTLYYLPVVGSKITLWNNTKGYYELVDIGTGLSASLSGKTSGLIYDVFVRNNEDGTASLSFGTAWSSNTARFASLFISSGMAFLTSGANQDYRYVGTIMINGSGTSEDSAQNRLCWNQYNQVPRKLLMNYTGSTGWTFTGSSGVSIRPVNNDSSAQLSFVVGGFGDTVGSAFVDLTAFLVANWPTAGQGFFYVLLSLDQTSGWTNTSDIISACNSIYATPVNAKLAYVPPLGFHWVTLLEQINVLVSSATLSTGSPHPGLQGFITA